MSNFSERVVKKLQDYIPEAQKEGFMKISARCLRERLDSGLDQLKAEIDKLDNKPSEDVVKEIEDLFNDYAKRTLSFLFHNKDAAGVAERLTKIAEKINMENLSVEDKTQFINETKHLLTLLEGATDVLPPELLAEVIRLSVVLSNIAKNGSDELKKMAEDFAEATNLLSSQQPKAEGPHGEMTNNIK